MRQGAIFRCFVALMLCVLSGCTSMDFILPEGPQGEQGVPGENGLSAYQLWVQEVLAGQIDWPADQITMQDFFIYLKGTDGRDGQDGQDGRPGTNGLSAYELWVQAVRDGLIRDPETGETWDSSHTSEADFFAYMAGGRGDDGLSAYELWKRDLADRADTDNPIIDNKTGEPWPPERDSLDDFYEFLRGRDGQDGEDGKDGQDGKPGEVGKPGTEVVIIEGVPNVVAQFSQSEFGEYVRTTDGGVLYHVYDEKGDLAPGAVVSGLPGIDGKTYTADENGAFIVPREDLPSVQDVNARWGTTRSVTIAGGTPTQSARNTYVPNRVDTRIRVTSVNLHGVEYDIDYVVERKLNPEDEWSSLPTYLPNAGSIKLELPQTYGKTSTSTKSELVLKGGNSSREQNGVYIYYVYAKMMIKSNILDMRNGYSDFGINDVYFTLQSTTKYYGTNIKWNGNALLTTGQMGPIVKSISLKTFRSGTDASFASMSGTLSYDHIDMTKIVKSVKLSEQSNGMQYIEPEFFTGTEAKARKRLYIDMRYESTSGSQRTDSSNKRSSYNEPEFTILSPYLNSSIETKFDYLPDHGDGLLAYSVGKLVRVGTTGNSFKVTPSNSKHPSISVTYSY